MLPPVARSTFGWVSTGSSSLQCPPTPVRDIKNIWGSFEWEALMTSCNSHHLARTKHADRHTTSWAVLGFRTFLHPQPALSEKGRHYVPTTVVGRRWMSHLIKRPKPGLQLASQKSSSLTSRGPQRWSPLRSHLYSSLEVGRALPASLFTLLRSASGSVWFVCNRCRFLPCTHTLWW